MATIDFNVTITDGAGIGVFIKVDGNDPLHFSTTSTQSLDLDPDDYTATISGAEPSSSTVGVAIQENGTVLAQTSFSETSFWGFLPFTVT